MSIGHSPSRASACQLGHGLVIRKIAVIVAVLHALARGPHRFQPASAAFRSNSLLDVAGADSRRGCDIPR